MRMRVSLLTRTVAWFFLNLLFIGGVLWLISLSKWGNLPDSRLRIEASQRIKALARLLVEEVRDKTTAERDAILQRYSNAYQVDFRIYNNDTGERLGGNAEPLPKAIVTELRRLPPNGEPPQGMPPPREALPPPREALPPPREALPPPREALPLDGNRRPLAFNTFSLKTSQPTRYWVGVRIPVFIQDRPERLRGTLLAVSDSASGNGLFFDPWPWLMIGALIVVLSILFWLPFVGHLTRFIEQMTRATEQIADERFDVRVKDERSDELGRLGKAINHLATRLAGFVTGQKRFLGDISHELNSPLARMQCALSILEERVEPAQRSYVADVQEEVQLMSRLVSELLNFAKAGLSSPSANLASVPLRALAQQVVERETNAQPANVLLNIDATLTVAANRELLARALGNVLRNAWHYAGAAEPIVISAQLEDTKVHLRITDNGPGVPPAALDKLFDPLYRVAADRARATGGSGLGLAIVKSCIEACQGSVSARNRAPHGLEITLTLPTDKNLEKS